MVAGFVEELLEVFIDAAGVGRTGSGNQKDQRRRVVLFGQAIFELFHCPEIVGQGEGPLRTHVQAVVSLVNVIVAGQLWAQVRRRGGDGRLERIGQWVAVTGGIDILCRSGRTQDKAAREGSEAQ
ncbi:hypothetical protein D3C79_633820 [compost metagenome]